MNRNMYRIIEKFSDETDAYEHIGCYTLREAQVIARLKARHAAKREGVYAYERNLASVLRDGYSLEFHVVPA